MLGCHGSTAFSLLASDCPAGGRSPATASRSARGNCACCCHVRVVLHRARPAQLAGFDPSITGRFRPVHRGDRGKTARLTADAWYYHAYLPSLVLDGDLDFANEYRITKHWYRCRAPVRPLGGDPRGCGRRRCTARPPVGRRRHARASARVRGQAVAALGSRGARLADSVRAPAFGVEGPVWRVRQQPSGARVHVVDRAGLE